MSPYLRKTGVASTFQFVLYTADGTALQPSATLAAGDVRIIKDGGAAANTTNLPVNEGQGVYSLVLTASEMGAARITVVLNDQTATETFLGTHFNVECWGTATGSQIEVDLEGSDPFVCNVEQIAGVTAAATNLYTQLSLIAGGQATTDAGNTSTSFLTNLSATSDDLYKYRVIKFTGGTGSIVGKYGFIRGYDGATKTLTTTDFGQTPVTGDTFIIV